MVSSRTGLTPHLRFRKAVLSRDRKAGVTHCPDCGCELDYEISRQPHSAEPDHIIPAAQARQLGWTDAQLNAPTNGRTICRRCNQSRGAGKPNKKINKTIQPSNGW
ncbi:HNH endonuclease signature motif containing protein [Microbacterium sp. NPDC078814]|uniref:HNH endonuclease signature motif containing protein n=1 Tax=Microbacterium sp. NPDC078814 TaxID=3154767 RepID=UPI00344D97AE